MSIGRSNMSFYVAELAKECKEECYHKAPHEHTESCDGAICTKTNKHCKCVEEKFYTVDLGETIKVPELKLELVWCYTCGGLYVKCPRCGNNSCNGGYGEDGKCPVCPQAYELMYLLSSTKIDKLIEKLMQWNIKK